MSNSAMQRLNESLHYRRVAASFDVSPETMDAFNAAVSSDAAELLLRVQLYASLVAREMRDKGPKFAPCGQAMASIPDFAEHIERCRTCGDALNE